MAKHKEYFDRRGFLKASGKGLAGAACPPRLAKALTAPGFSSPAKPPSLFWEDQMKLRRLQPVRCEVDGVPVYSFGDTFIYGQSPSLLSTPSLQVGNDAEMRKIRPKKSWEITANTMGATSPRVPRTELYDDQPFLGVHLIDGDRETCWMSRGQNQPDVEPVWVRLDLPKEAKISTIVLVPRADGQGLPEHLVLEVSRDAWHWEIVFAGSPEAIPQGPRGRTVSFDPRPVKQVRLTAMKCTEVAVPDQYGNKTWTFSFCFSLAGVELQDESGENLALVSRGAGVTVSSTARGAGDEKILHDQLWPVHYDLGLKWVRVAYWDSVLNWLYVEREKGVLRVDPLADQTITECYRNGLNVVLCLAYGNWLYTPEGRRPHPKQILETPWEMAPPPTTPQMLEGYERFVRFMVRHFRDRVRYFEIWNEPGAKYAWGNNPNPAEYAALVKKIAPVIRQEAPQAKIVLAEAGFPPGRADGFLEACLKQGVAQLVDVMTIHPFYGNSQGSQDYLEYPDHIRAWKKLAESHGFQGEYMATESGWYAPYPIPVHPFIGGDVTEIVKAKYLAKFMVINNAFSMPAFWNETWQDQFTYWDGTLMRSTFSADPVCPLQPQAAYYVMRTLSTVLEGAQPIDSTLEFRGPSAKLDSYLFRVPDGSRLAAYWVPGAGSDDSPDARADVVIHGFSPTKATGIDVLDGTEQELKISVEAGTIVLKGMLVTDYPLLVRLK
jgi:hypothetical protein